MKERCPDCGEEMEYIANDLICMSCNFSQDSMDKTMNNDDDRYGGREYEDRLCGKKIIRIIQ